MMILLFVSFADFGFSSFSRAMLNVKVQPSIFPMQAPEKTPDLLTSLGRFAGKVVFSWTLTVDV